MLFPEEKYELKGREIVLRPARADEAEMLIDYLKIVNGETRFLTCDSDEITHTVESEVEFIENKNKSDNAMFMLAFVDGDYAGTCSFSTKSNSRRGKHRAEIGIALFLKYTNFGLGRLMLTRLIEKIKESGFEQAELQVNSENARARHLYESLGFVECGRIPNAFKYVDGTYADEITMVLQFKK